MKYLVPLICPALLLASIGIASAAPIPKEKNLLEGTWVIQTATWCGKPVPFLDEDKKELKSILWRFTEDKYAAFVGGPKDAYEEGTFSINIEKSPKHLDLKPSKDELLSTGKVAFEVDGDELRIGSTLWFAPGKREDEIEGGKKIRSTRPSTIKPGKDDLILLLILKRKKD